MADLYICYNGKPQMDSKGAPVLEADGKTPVIDSAPFFDRYDGVDYEFPVGETVGIPHAAARHIFGYGDLDKTRALRRQGVMNHSSEMRKGQEWLGMFEFKEVEPPPPPVLGKQKSLKEVQTAGSAEALEPPIPPPSRRERLPQHNAV